MRCMRLLFSLSNCNSMYTLSSTLGGVVRVSGGAVYYNVHHLTFVRASEMSKRLV
jgi:hypothetical protein